jgi:hypothetical protein
MEERMILSAEETRRARISDKASLRQEMVLRPQGIIGEFLPDG